MPPFFLEATLRFRISAVLLGLLCIMAGAHAQTPLSTNGTSIDVSAFGEATHPNDEARVVLWIEEQDQEKGVAASRVNQKMRQGMEIVARTDPQAILKTRGYYSHPIYPEQPRPAGSPARQAASWRVGQYLEVTTANLQGLPKTIAAAQGMLALNGLHFALSKSTIRKLDQQRIEAAYTDLYRRIGIITKAMGRNVNEVMVEKIELDDSDIYSPRLQVQPAASMRGGASMESMQVQEPSFEPGETTLGIRISGKLRLK
jgi:uncharacterized protein YggE